MKFLIYLYLWCDCVLGKLKKVKGNNRDKERNKEVINKRITERSSRKEEIYKRIREEMERKIRKKKIIKLRRFHIKDI